MNIEKPMLAVAIEDLETLKLPVLASPKLDGIRCIKVGGKALSRKFKPIPNHHIRNWIEANLPDGIDGEIMSPGVKFNDLQSLVMSEEGTPAFTYNAFDYVHPASVGQLPFYQRYQNLQRIVSEVNKPELVLVEHTVVESIGQLQRIEEKTVAAGFEGVMVRSFDGPYKFGRSTLKEQYLLKIKRFYDSEAVINGMTEQMHNDNVAEKSELGYTKRSHKKEGMVPAGIMGNLLVNDLGTGTGFEIGSGFTADERARLWHNQSEFLGKIVKYKYQELGPNGKPRFPVFLGFRDARDMS
jgi:DNA ligase-1